jgi:hypothetical protein
MSQLGPNLGRSELGSGEGDKTSFPLLVCFFSSADGGRQGSVSVTDRGLSATITSRSAVRESICQSVLLGLKFLIIKKFLKTKLIFSIKSDDHRVQ